MSDCFAASDPRLRDAFVILKKMKLYLSYAALFAWMAVIFLLSSEGHDASSGRSDEIVRVLQGIGLGWQTDLLTFLTRKAAHTVAYMVLGGLAYNVLRQYAVATRWRVLGSMAVVVLYAVSDELHQLYVPGRSGELRDVAIDSVAGCVAVLLAHIAYKRYLLHKSQK